MPHKPGAHYTREAIRAEYNADGTTPWFVVRHGDKVCALRLRRSNNPRISSTPAQVWIGKGADREPWGERLATVAGPIQLYVAETDNEDIYTYLGAYHVTGTTQEPQDLLAAQQMPGIGPLSRIVYLTGLHE